MIGVGQSNCPAKILTTASTPVWVWLGRFMIRISLNLWGPVLQ